MILTCPSCATGYFVPDEAIGAEGRKVRCKSCSHVWLARRDDEPLDLSTPPEAAPENATIEAAGTHHLAGLPPEALAEAPAEELPKAFRARAEQNRRLRRAATHGAVWAGLASVFAGILASAWLFRIEVVELWPRAAAAYAFVGTEVNTVGLDFEAVGARPLRNDPGRVVVSGALRNIREREVVAPSVRVALLDAHGNEIAHSIVPIRAAPVLPGKLQGFAVVMPDPAARAAGVGVQFVKAEPKKAAAEAVPHTPPAASTGDHTPDHAPAPADPHALQTPPAGAEGGLRPAIGDLGISASAPAVDAHPVTETPPPPAPPPAAKAPAKAAHH